MSTGLILFAHGSRDPLWHRPLLAVQAQVQRLQPQLRVGLAYLELSTPTLETCVLEMVRQGCPALQICPLFLGSGRHVREDLPGLVAQIQARVPQVPLRLVEAVGEDPRLIDFLAQLALAQLAEAAAAGRSHAA